MNWLLLKIKNLLASLKLVLGNERGTIGGSGGITYSTGDTDISGSETYESGTQIQLPDLGPEGEALLSQLLSLFLPTTGGLIPSGDFNQAKREDISYEQWDALQKSDFGTTYMGMEPIETEWLNQSYHPGTWDALQTEAGWQINPYKDAIAYKLDENGQIWYQTPNWEILESKWQDRSMWNKWGPAYGEDRDWIRIDDAEQAAEIKQQFYSDWQSQGSPGDTFITQGMVEQVIEEPLYDIPSLMEDYTSGVAGALAQYGTSSGELTDAWQDFMSHYGGIESGLLSQIADQQGNYETQMARIPGLNLALPGGGAVPLAPKAHSDVYSQQLNSLLEGTLGAGQIAQAGAEQQAAGLGQQAGLMQDLYTTSIDAIVRDQLPLQLALALLSGFQAEQLAQPTTLGWGTTNTEGSSDTSGHGFDLGLGLGLDLGS